jgi:hypothetical protein
VFVREEDFQIKTTSFTDFRRTSAYIEAMDLVAIVQSIDDEIDRLQRVRSLLTAHTAPLKRGFPTTEQDSPTRKRRKTSEEGRARTAAAQRKRWAKAKEK